MSQRKSRELDRIDWLARLCTPASRERAPLGIGDDAALLRPRAGRDLVLTTDAQIEGTHFAPGWLSAEEIGRRAVESAVSDLAAMAAEPRALLVTLAIEAERDDTFFHGLVRGLEAGARHHDAPILGGNTSRGPLAISMTAIGDVPRGQALRRDTLRVGQELWVTGAPGLARLGLESIRAAKEAHADPSVPAASPASRTQDPEDPAGRAFRAPRARVAEALTLARVWRARAAIDLSDGLASDLGQLLEATRRSRGEPDEALGAGTGIGVGVGIEIEIESLRSIEPLASLCRRAGREPAEVALAGGEDYELLVAIDAGTATAPRLAAWRRRELTPLTRIGHVVARPGLHLVESDGTRRKIPFVGFEHF